MSTPNSERMSGAEPNNWVSLSLAVTCAIEEITKRMLEDNKNEFNKIERRIP
jgi:hypothetical protein